MFQKFPLKCSKSKNVECIPPGKSRVIKRLLLKFCLMLNPCTIWISLYDIWFYINFKILYSARCKLILLKDFSTAFCRHSLTHMITTYSQRDGSLLWETLFYAHHLGFLKCLSKYFLYMDLCNTSHLNHSSECFYYRNLFKQWRLHKPDRSSQCILGLLIYFLMLFLALFSFFLEK